MTREIVQTGESTWVILEVGDNIAVSENFHSYSDAFNARGDDRKGLGHGLLPRDSYAGACQRLGVRVERLMRELTKALRIREIEPTTGAFILGFSACLVAEYLGIIFYMEIFGGV